MEKSEVEFKMYICTTKPNTNDMYIHDINKSTYSIMQCSCFKNKLAVKHLLIRLELPAAFNLSGLKGKTATLSSSKLIFPFFVIKLTLTLQHYENNTPFTKLNKYFC